LQSLPRLGPLSLVPLGPPTLLKSQLSADTLKFVGAELPAPANKEEVPPIPFTPLYEIVKAIERATKGLDPTAIVRSLAEEATCRLLGRVQSSPGSPRTLLSLSFSATFWSGLHSCRRVKGIIIIEVAGKPRESRKNSCEQRAAAPLNPPASVRRKFAVNSIILRCGDMNIA
jgi:hypothetical protein